MPRARRRTTGLAVALLALAGCGDDDALPGGGGGTASSTASASTVAGSSVSSGSGGGDGGSGGGGEEACVFGCPEERPLCEDGLCTASCSADRLACDSSEGPTCCEQGLVCCEGSEPGTSACRAACETTCDDGITVCAFPTLCEMLPADGSFSCVDPSECQQQRLCGGQCCPLGSRCEGDRCPLPDLVIDVPTITASVELDAEHFAPDACEVPEGCIGGTGRRRLLRFDLKTPNVGEGDLFMGKPCEDPEDPDPTCADPDLFLFDNCHGHPHFESYAAYRLLDAEGRVAAAGHKQAFCLLDYERQEGGAPNAVYHCAFQGIQAGWADVYYAELPCQWVDVTDVPPGDYRLEVRLNVDRLLVEASYDDVALVDVSISPDSCPLGCADFDGEVCQEGDPEGRAGDGRCDCLGLWPWDVDDCLSCAGCATTSCPGGCPDTPVECCGDEDACGLARDGACDCGGAAPWDQEDCGRCTSSDPACPI